MYTEGPEVETKVASAYVCKYRRMSYRLRDSCNIFTAEVETINKALEYVWFFGERQNVIFTISVYYRPLYAKRVRIVL